VQALERASEMLAHADDDMTSILLEISDLESDPKNQLSVREYPSPNRDN
jgi:hypothetical protein